LAVLSIQNQAMPQEQLTGFKILYIIQKLYLL